MTMTRESDYAVRIMRALSHGSLKTVREICGEEAIPTQFAYKILKKLSNAGLIQIIRGAAGGYKLDKDLHDVSLLDIMHAIGEKGVVNACIRELDVLPFTKFYMENPKGKRTKYPALPLFLFIFLI